MMNDKPSTQNPSALFRTWLQEHAGLLYKVAHAFAPTEADREELTQEILGFHARFEGKAKASTWVYRLALNTAMAWKRKEKSRSVHVSLLAIEDLPAQSAKEKLTQDRELVLCHS